MSTGLIALLDDVAGLARVAASSSVIREVNSRSTPAMCTIAALLSAARPDLANSAMSPWQKHFSDRPPPDGLTLL